MMPVQSICNNPREAWSLCNEVLGELLLEFNGEIFGIIDRSDAQMVEHNLQNATKILAQLVGHVYSIVYRLELLGFPEYADDMRILLHALITEDLQDMAVQDHIHAVASQLASQEL